MIEMLPDMPDDTYGMLASWLIPGEMRTFSADQLDAAKEWVAGSAHDAPSSASPSP